MISILHMDLTNKATTTTVFVYDISILFKYHYFTMLSILLRSFPNLNDLNLLINKHFALVVSASPR